MKRTKLFLAFSAILTLVCAFGFAQLPLTGVILPDPNKADEVSMEMAARAVQSSHPFTSMMDATVGGVHVQVIESKPKDGSAGVARLILTDKAGHETMTRWGCAVHFAQAFGTVTETWANTWNRNDPNYQPAAYKLTYVYDPRGIKLGIDAPAEGIHVLPTSLNPGGYASMSLSD